MTADDGTEAMPLCELAEYEHYVEWCFEQGFPVLKTDDDAA